MMRSRFSPSFVNFFYYDDVIVQEEKRNYYPSNATPEKRVL